MKSLLKIDLRKFAREPLLILAALWPFVLLAPHVPGLPRPSLSGLPWRQELTLSALLCLTLALIIRHARANSGSPSSTRPLNLRLLLCGALFASWVWLSATWAALPTSAVHLAFQWSAYLIFLALLSGPAARPRVVRASFTALGAIVWILGVSCAVESWFGAPLTEGSLRNGLKPLFRGSGGFGEIMAVAAPLFAALALRAKRPRLALLCGATATLAWMATLQSLERAPFIGAAVGVLFFFSIALLKSNCRPRQLSRLALLAVVFAAVLAPQVWPTSHARRDSSTLTRLQGGFSNDANTHVRLLFWGVGLEMLREHPLLGVGGNNYEVDYTHARAQFSARHPDSTLVGLNDSFLTIYAHNEYVQMLAELGVIGFSLFVLFAAALVATFRRALKHPTQALHALGAGAGMLAFAISSGASASSFRYFGGGLLFFFAAALVVRVAHGVPGHERVASDNFVRRQTDRRPALTWCALALALCMFCGFVAQAASSILHGMAQTSADRPRAESFYRASLSFDPSSAPTHFSYGMWLSTGGRATDALPHLRYAVSRGISTSVCYAYLATTEDAAGESDAAERTLGEAVRVYPRSVFLRVRHAAELERAGRDREAGLEMSAASLIDSRAARGWYQLIVRDIDAAIAAALEDKSVARPGELQPQDAVFAVLSENEKRFPEAVNSGWRARMRSSKY